jgi:hypothetical protein
MATLRRMHEAGAFLPLAWAVASLLRIPSVDAVKGTVDGVAVFDTVRGVELMGPEPESR